MLSIEGVCGKNTHNQEHSTPEMSFFFFNINGETTIFNSHTEHIFTRIWTQASYKCNSLKQTYIAKIL